MTKDAFTLSLRQAHEFERVAGASGWTNEDFIRLIQDWDMLSAFLAVMRGQADVRSRSSIVDLDEDPLSRHEWTWLEHRKGGQLDLGRSKISLYRSEHQCGPGSIDGFGLRKELADEPVLNENLLDWLLKPENRHHLPEEWKGKKVCFWGTVWTDSEGHCFVRCLFWRDGQWHWLHRALRETWGADDYAAVLAG